MDRVATRTNVAELLLAVTSSAIIAFLVLAAGAAIGDHVVDPEPLAASAVAASEGRIVAAEREVIRPTSVLCCALIYADPNASQ